MGVTIRDVAREAKVSVATVSYVLNGLQTISPATRERVMEVVRLLDYHPNSAARSLANRRTETIAFLIPAARSAADPFLMQFISGAVDAAGRRRYGLLLTSADGGRRALEALVKKRQVDGVILMEAEERDPRIDLLLHREFPFVLFGRSLEHPQVPSIDVDNWKGAFLATEHLTQLGHRRIGFIGASRKLVFGWLRKEGYKAALEQAGLRPDPTLCATGELTEVFGYEAMRRFLALPEPPTAVFACSDLTAIGARKALREAGLRVPEQVSLVGYDNAPVAEFAQPPLTTVAQPTRLLGERAVEMLIDLVTGKVASQSLEIVVPELVVRGSTGPVPL